MRQEEEYVCCFASNQDCERSGLRVYGEQERRVSKIEKQEPGEKPVVVSGINGGRVGTI